MYINKSDGKGLIKELVEIAVPKIESIEELYQNSDKELAIINAERELKEKAFYSEYGEVCLN